MDHLKKLGWPYWVVGICLGLVVPAVAQLLAVSAVIRFGILLLVINGGAAIAVGRVIARRQQPKWWVLIFPVCYWLGAYAFLPRYTQYFALVYLCLSYLTAGLSTMVTTQETKN
ncbi:hypothetical protein [Levilactobacillus namurensis]|uniref:Integral membrane protein n=1 Tax=Levilactobacillus namurensis TaxID=380393 RepID=A0AAW8W7S7_9LACO|nr:hypothetical protein [Levilactobacillus namurensis]MDT7014555.1 hypothetical protein [Levilactobacillus namurensis]